jgi:hypothetical protein
LTVAELFRDKRKKGKGEPAADSPFSFVDPPAFAAGGGGASAATTS